MRGHLNSYVWIVLTRQQGSALHVPHHQSKTLFQQPVVLVISSRLTRRRSSPLNIIWASTRTYSGALSQLVNIRLVCVYIQYTRPNKPQ